VRAKVCARQAAHHLPTGSLVTTSSPPIVARRLACTTGAFTWVRFVAVVWLGVERGWRECQASLVPHSQAMRVGVAAHMYRWCAVRAGYGAAYGIGNVIAHNWGWRAMFKLFGIPGMVLAVFVATLHEPKRGRLETETETEAEKNDPASPTMEADASRCGLRHGNATCDPPESTLASSAAAVRGPHDSNTPSAVYSSSSAVASQPPPQQARQSRKQQQQQQQHALLPVLSETAEACTAPAKKEKKKEPRKAKRRTRSTSRPASAADIARYWCGAKSLLLLCVAGAVRNAGGYVWAYNTNLFFENVRHQTAAQIATYLGWVPLLGGSIGALVGGAISDRVVKRGTVTGRLWVLVISQV